MANEFSKSEIQSSDSETFNVRLDHKRRNKDKKLRHKKRKKKSGHHSRISSEISSREKKSSGSEEISKNQKLEKLRQERLDREAKERKRLTDLLMPAESTKECKEQNAVKYNSQFNPALARQNKFVELRY